METRYQVYFMHLPFALEKAHHTIHFNPYASQFNRSSLSTLNFERAYICFESEIVIRKTKVMHNTGRHHFRSVNFKTSFPNFILID